MYERSNVCTNDWTKLPQIFSASFSHTPQALHAFTWLKQIKIKNIDRKSNIPTNHWKNLNSSWVRHGGGVIHFSKWSKQQRRRHPPWITVRVGMIFRRGQKLYFQRSNISPDESKTPTLFGAIIPWNVNVADIPEFVKNFPQRFWCGAVGEVVHL